MFDSPEPAIPLVDDELAILETELEKLREAFKNELDEDEVDTGKLDRLLQSICNLCKLQGARKAKQQQTKSNFVSQPFDTRSHQRALLSPPEFSFYSGNQTEDLKKWAAAVRQEAFRKRMNVETPEACIWVAGKFNGPAKAWWQTRQERYSEHPAGGLNGFADVEAELR